MRYKSRAEKKVLLKVMAKSCLPMALAKSFVARILDLAFLLSSIKICLMRESRS